MCVGVILSRDSVEEKNQGRSYEICKVIEMSVYSLPRILLRFFSFSIRPFAPLSQRFLLTSFLSNPCRELRMSQQTARILHFLLQSVLLLFLSCACEILVTFLSVSLFPYSCK